MLRCAARYGVQTPGQHAARCSFFRGAFRIIEATGGPRGVETYELA